MLLQFLVFPSTYSICVGLSLEFLEDYVIIFFEMWKIKHLDSCVYQLEMSDVYSFIVSSLYVKIRTKSMNIKLMKMIKMST